MDVKTERKRERGGKISKLIKLVLAVWGGICSFQGMIYNVNITLCLDSEQVLFDYNTWHNWHKF